MLPAYLCRYDPQNDVRNFFKPHGSPLRKTQLNTGNKDFYTRMEYRRIRGYTVHARIRGHTNTHSVSV